jgi:hypothetical protein
MSEIASDIVARPLADWHEDDGPALWWRFPIDEPPYVGTPLDLGYTVEVHVTAGLVSLGNVGGWPGYHTHWTPIPLPARPSERASVQASEGASTHADAGEVTP